MFDDLNAGDPTKFTYAPDLNHPSVYEQWHGDESAKVTWQADPRNNIGFLFDNQNLCQCPRFAISLNIIQRGFGSGRLGSRVRRFKPATRSMRGRLTGESVHSRSSLRSTRVTSRSSPRHHHTTRGTLTSTRANSCGRTRCLSIAGARARRRRAAYLLWLVGRQEG